jgi:hypothetical protein
MISWGDQAFAARVLVGGKHWGAAKISPPVSFHDRVREV